jgi:hypothetical protein
MKNAVHWVLVTFAVAAALGIFNAAMKAPEQEATQRIERDARLAQREDQRDREALINVAKPGRMDASDQRLKIRRFKVTGTVSNISTVASGETYITLVGAQGSPMVLQFEFGEADQGTPAKLNKGQKVTIACVGTDDFGTMTISDSCTIL